MALNKPKASFTACIMLVALSCGHKDTLGDGVIDVSMTEGRIEWEELFDSIRVIPLETSDSVLLTGTGRATIWEGDMYILNRDRVFRFDSLGRFKNIIGRLGNGPGEYRYAYDFDFNPETGNIFILSPFGTVYEYSTEGMFIVEHELPAKPNYQRLRRLKDGKWLAWTDVFYGDKPISILSNDLVECIYTPDIKMHAVNTEWTTPDFYTYNSQIYMSPLFDQTTYIVSSDTIVSAYRLNFSDGKNICEETLSKYDETPSMDWEENRKRDMDFFKDTDIAFSFSSSNMNSRYIFKKIVEKVEVDDQMRQKSTPGVYFLFHDYCTGKNTGGSQIGNGLMRGAVLLMNDDYILGKMAWNDLSLYKSFLPDGMRLEDVNPDDDNPLLVKYYFKK